MTVGSADRQKPTQNLDELLAQKTHKVAICKLFYTFLFYYVYSA
ncbi:hypothetical protein [Rivularia sp. UHCC 0363]|nr:hypothetical protein [Rivularia sp. UHCC 0363]MEA5598492.1 hypothetical protein [Rivularia sp. UHCC 0363]